MNFLTLTLIWQVPISVGPIQLFGRISSMQVYMGQDAS
jgi:hypothetical protein